MPRLPSIDQRPTPRFGGVTQIPEKGQAVGQVTERLGAAIAGFGEVMAREKVKDDKFKVEDATTRLQQRMLDLSKGEEGFTHVRAGDVSNTFHEDQMQRFDAARKEIEDSLTDDSQREMFARRADVSRVGYGENLINHITKENNVFNEQIYEGGVSTELDLAASSYINENEVKRALLRTEKLTEAEAGRLGLKGDAKKALLKENKSNIHVQVIAQAVDDGNYQYAKDWFSKNQKHIEGERQDDVKRLLKNSGIKASSQEAVDDYVDRGLSEAEARAEARKLDPDNRDATLDRITSRYSEASQILDRQQKAFGESARTTYANAIDAGEDPESAYDAIPESVLDGMDGGERMTLQNRAKLDSKGEDYPNGGPDYYGLKVMARDDPKGFQAVNPFKYKLSETDRKEIIKLQTDEKELTVSRTKTQVLSQGAAAIGLSPKDANKDTDDGKDVRAFYQRVDSELEAFQAQTGKEPTTKDVSDIVDRLSIEVVRDPKAWLFKGERPAAAAEVKGVPPEYIDELAQRLIEMGEPITDDNIRRGYAAIK